MKNPLIEELQKKRNAARFTAHQTSTYAAWHEFRLVRNKLKSATTAQKAFIEKALYSNKSREVWKVIHRVLKPSARPLRFDPDELNDFFAKTAQRTLETQATPIEDLMCLIANLPDVPSGGMHFQLSPVTSENFLQVIKNLLSDCSTGADQIPTRFLKLVAECLAVPLRSIINHCIAKDYFPKQWKIARVSPVPKIDNPVSKDQLQPFSVLPVLSKVFEKLVAIQMTNYADHVHLLHDRISAFRKGHSLSLDES
ncbi:putative RNA-directed DNA polymerase from transposon X-element [Acropora cervicornis]|uniref:RNA-directed DNA polymerase from transposon X-element n=1 Tax=Acropora cervicornis TaxID=6130 RepID=A0AAD9V2G4_ACRCE|nr:putative RNA-directed DNA polymerase from transposon X-element [Acropora cervicornis]